MTRSFFFITYTNQHRETMDLLQTRNVAHGRRTYRIRHSRSWERLFGSHTHHAESSRKCRIFPANSKRYRRWHLRVQSRPCKSFTAFHVQPNQHIFQSKICVTQNNAYAYRIYIEALLNYSLPEKTSYLTSCLWDSDIPSLMNALLESQTPNLALVRCACYLYSRQALNLIGHLHCDVFNQDKFLINGVEVRMRLVCLKDLFCLMESNSVSKIHLLDASLLIRKAKISPGVSFSYVKMLSKTTVFLQKSKLKHLRFMTNYQTIKTRNSWFCR